MLLRLFTVLAVAALAIATWILSNQSRTRGPAAPAPGADMPGYYLKGTVMTDYNIAGAPSVKIAAERIEQIGQSNDVELHNVRMDYQSSADQMWVMVGDKAHVQQDGKVVEVSGNVQMQGLDMGRQGPAVVTTDHISYDIISSLVHTDSVVHISFGQHTLSGLGLVAHLKDRTLRLQSKVYGRFIP